MSWENLIKDQSIIPQVASVFFLDYVLIKLLFSHDVTKIQTKKLSILPTFYFHDALEKLKTNFHTNFASKGFLVFVIDYA